MTLTQDQVIKAKAKSKKVKKTPFEKAYAALSDGEKAMFAALEKDETKALELMKKPLLGIFRRRGQVRFVILRKDCAFMNEFNKAGVQRSSIVLDEDHPVTIETIQNLLDLLRLKAGTRANGLVEHDKCAGVDYDYFDYHIDQEAD